jgi:hypothetical protein
MELLFIIRECGQLREGWWEAISPYYNLEAAHGFRTWRGPIYGKRGKKREKGGKNEVLKRTGDPTIGHFVS